MAGKREVEDRARFEREIEPSELRAAGRLCKSFGFLLQWLWMDGGNSKAAYRFSGNGRVREKDILSGAFSGNRAAH